MTPIRRPVTAGDVDQAVLRALSTLRQVPDDAWDVPAPRLGWTRWSTVEHLVDGLFFYAAELGPRHPPLDHEVPYLNTQKAPGGPFAAVYVDPQAGVPGLLTALEASAGIAVAVFAARPPEHRGYHDSGVSDPEGFAAMSVVEVLVHTDDVVDGLELDWQPPAELCERALGRLFPDAPDGGDPWPTLLWATGRGTLPGLDRRERWSWRAAPLPASEVGR